MLLELKCICSRLMPSWWLTSAYTVETSRSVGKKKSFFYKGIAKIDAMEVKAFGLLVLIMQFKYALLNTHVFLSEDNIQPHTGHAVLKLLNCCNVSLTGCPVNVQLCPFEYQQ